MVPGCFASTDPVMQRFAGVDHERQGIFDGALSPPTTANAASNATL